VTKGFQQDAEVTPVIFRIHRDTKNHGSEVTAIFPCDPADLDGHKMACYAHVGQHGSCNYGWYLETRPTFPEEYADLHRLRRVTRLARVSVRPTPARVARPQLNGRQVKPAVRWVGCRSP
jgi:hypothetical protein